MAFHTHRWSWRSNESGAALVEFGLAFPMLLAASTGAIASAVLLDMQGSVVDFTRNGAMLFAQTTDFSRTENKDLLLRGAAGLDITRDGGKGVIYLSRLIEGSPGTANAGRLAIAERHVIGNTAIHTSEIGTPDSGIWPRLNSKVPNGNVVDFENQISARATVSRFVFSAYPTESLFVAEVYYKPAALPFSNLFGVSLLSSVFVF